MHVRRIINFSKSALILLLVYTVIITATSIGHFENVTVINAAKAGIEQIGDSSVSIPKPDITDYSGIIENDPFGTSAEMSMYDNMYLSGNAVQVNDTVSENTGLVLMGTVAGSEAIARAIIKDSSTSKTDFYKIGQFVGNARIEGIENESVILFQQGQRKVLSLTSWASSRKVNSSIDQIKIEPEEAFAKHTDIRGNTEITIPRKQEFAQEMLAKTTIEPYIVYGNSEGLKISGLENFEFAEKIGLKDGDIISSVNGHELTSKQKAMQVLKKARNKKQISLNIIREDKPKNISFKLL